LQTKLTCYFGVKVSVLGWALASEDGAFAEAAGPDFDNPKYLGEGIGIGIRKGDDELKARLNKAIKAIRANGTYQKINEKYFAFDVYGAE
jgi:ABC-type amino acid transport substrate-binding protein